MDNSRVVNQKAQQFWDAYRACAEAHHVAFQRSNFYVHWVKNLVEFIPEKKLRNRSAGEFSVF